MRCLRILAALLVGSLASATHATADVQLPKIFGDHMVLTQRTRAKLWGFAVPGEKVEIEASWQEKSVDAATDKNGRFEVDLTTPAAGGPYTITFRAANTVVLDDVWIGEVWLCAGQSNMEMSVGAQDGGYAGVLRWQEEVAAADHPRIRMFNVTRATAREPKTVCEGAWTPCTRETAARFSATAYFYARELERELDVPIGLIHAAWGGTPAQAWTSAQALRTHGGFDAEFAALGALPPAATVDPRAPAALFNAMIAPLVPFPIRGVIWYQGEANRDRAEEYRTLFPALVRDWRARFGKNGALGELPFYFVQLAPFAYPDDAGETAIVRDAQLGALALPETGMAVTMDIGDARDIHPKNKQEVGRRLALWALDRTYAKPRECSGPLPRGARREGEVLRLWFDHADGLAVRGSALTGFEIADSKGSFVPARARLDGSTVLVSSDAVKEPVSVRYLWAAVAEPTLVNSAGLPASPFRARAGDAPADATAEPLFNGRDLTGWRNVNGAASTWTARDGVLATTGVPTGVLATERRFENFVLDVDWRHLQPKGNSGIFVWSDLMPAVGQPFPRAVEVQVMDGTEGDGFTSDGDVFPIHGATLAPENGRAGGQRAFPTEKRMQPAPEWNHYRITCESGAISLAVNGKVVTRGKDALPREGHICLEAEGSPVEFKNLWIRELPSTRVASANDGSRPSGATNASNATNAPSANNTTNASNGNDAGDAARWSALYDGVGFAGWRTSPQVQSTWVAKDWTLACVGRAPTLWTERAFDDFVMTIDWRPAGKDRDTEIDRETFDQAILVRGDTRLVVQLDAPKDPSQWTRAMLTVRGDKWQLVQNGALRMEGSLMGKHIAGPIGLRPRRGVVEFANIYVREL